MTSKTGSDLWWPWFLGDVNKNHIFGLRMVSTVTICNMVTFCKKWNFKVILTFTTPGELLGRKWQVHVAYGKILVRTQCNCGANFKSICPAVFEIWDDLQNRKWPSGADDLGGHSAKNNRCRPLTISNLLWKFQVTSCSIFWVNRAEKMLTDRQTNGADQHTCEKSKIFGK